MKPHNKQSNGFLGKSIYASGIIKKDEFWYVVKDLLDWNKLAKELENLFKNGATGASNYSPVVMLKILFIQRMYNASDRSVSEMCTQTIKLKYFLGLEIQEEAPDYSTISKFRTNIIKKYGEAYFAGLFDGILATIKSLGVHIGGSYVIDSTITYADVNPFKDEKRVEEGEERRDSEASWTAKSRPGRDDEGKKTSRKTWYYGYKSHSLVDSTTDIIASLIADTARYHDGRYTNGLVKQNLTKGLPIDELTGDKAYGQDVVNIHILEEAYGICSAFLLKKSSYTTGALEDQIHWQDYVQDPRRNAIRKKRSGIEKVFADEKQNHGLGRALYLGKTKYAMQSYLSAICHNVKRTIMLLFGISFHIS